MKSWLHKHEWLDPTYYILQQNLQQLQNYSFQIL